MKKMVMAAGLALALVPSPAVADEPTWRASTPAWTWPGRLLNDVEPAGARDVWAVGKQGERHEWWVWDCPTWTCMSGHYAVNIWPKPVLQHWTGSWTSISPPGISGEGELFDVSAAAADDVWIAGRSSGQKDGPLYLARWNGTKVTQVAAPPVTVSAAKVAADAQGLWLLAANTLYRGTGDGAWTVAATGVQQMKAYGPNRVAVWNAGTLREYRDGTWQTLPSPSGRTLNYFALAFGDYWAWPVAGAEPAFRWTGTAWETVAKPVTDHEFLSAFAVGDELWTRGILAGTSPLHEQWWRRTATGWETLPEPPEGLHIDLPKTPGWAIAHTGYPSADQYTILHRTTTGWLRSTTLTAAAEFLFPLPGTPHLFNAGTDVTGNLTALTTAP